ncbi:MAG TPA: DUF3341 domain-containing protein [Myxococcales bacterium]|jgi:hypothetical protein
MPTTTHALVLARFETPELLLAAARKLRDGGHSALDLLSPFPIEGASEVLELKRSPVPLTVLVSALSGAGIGYSMQLFCNAVDWPINVGNRPPHAFLSFVPITFELAVLFGGLSALFALLWLFRFPMPWHPTQLCEPFRSATVDGLWLSLGLDPTRWDLDTVSSELRGLGAKELSVVFEEEP